MTVPPARQPGENAAHPPTWHAKGWCVLDLLNEELGVKLLVGEGVHPHTRS
jgi:hypothetical protein